MNNVLNQTYAGFRQQLVLLNNVVLYNHDGLQIAYGPTHHKCTRHVQGYSYVPPGFPNSTAQQPRQTRQKGAYQ